MANLADPFSASYNWQISIPEWERGSKVSLSSDDGGCCDGNTGVYWDSSDLSSSSDESDILTEFEDALASSSEKGKSKERDSLLSTPRAKNNKSSTNRMKGLNKTMPMSPDKTVKLRMRSASTTSEQVSVLQPGPAARALAAITNAGVSDGGRSKTLSASPVGLQRPEIIQRQSNRSLTRAQSSPQALVEGGAILNAGYSPVDRVIQRAFDTRHGDVELSSSSLVSLPPSIGDLGMIVSLDLKTGKSLPTPIQLYLANNHLSSSGLHPNLFNLKNLTVLSLRHNNLDELPTAVGKLKNLRELNLSVNNLRTLPAEILQLQLSSLSLVSNPFIKYRAPASASPASSVPKNSDVHSAGRICSTRQQSFRVPSLVELVTRSLLAPIPFDDAHKRRSWSPSSTIRSSTSTSTFVRRGFHTIRNELLSPRTDVLPPPPHLLRPFLPLMNPIPHHLRHLLTDSSSAPTSGSVARSLHVPTMVLQCSNPNCSTYCFEFAETRIEWRNEIAGQKFAEEGDIDQYIPILWRGCSANCLDFLEC